RQSGRVLVKGLGIAGVGLGLSLSLRPSIRCEPTPSATSPGPTPSKGQPDEIPPPPESTVSLYELSFGSVAGICAGVFIKKGLKTVAFFLGGVFVLLQQYLGSYSVIRVDWAAIGRRFEKLFYTTDATGQRKAPTVHTAWSWLVDFLVADFQPRASFLAGLILGLRIG
ncbi:hypothetical protein K435DRAFT_558387, partial [Dendrothele bispora CBS 962.96]